MGSHLQSGDRQAVSGMPTLCAHICSLTLILLSYQVCVTLAMLVGITDVPLPRGYMQFLRLETGLSSLPLTLSPQEILAS